MAKACYRVRAGDPDFGRTCSLCAGPKSKQARKCAACYRDQKLVQNARFACLRDREHGLTWLEGTRLLNAMLRAEAA